MMTLTCDKKQILAFFASMLPVIFWLMGNWPGLASPDTADSFRQAQENSYNDMHPVSFTLYLKALSINGNFPELYLLIQVALFYFGLLIAFKLLTRGKTSRSLLMVGTCFSTPVVGATATTVWRDSAMTGLIILGAAILGTKAKRANIMAILLLGLGLSMRHEGWIVGLLCVILFMLIGKLYKQSLRGVVHTFLASSLFAFTYIMGASHITNAQPVHDIQRYSAFLHDMTYARVVLGENMDSETTKFIDTMFPENVRDQALKCESAGYLTYQDGNDLDAIDRQSDEIIKVWINTLKSHPYTVLKARTCKIQAFLPPGLSVGPSYVYWWPSEIETSNVFTSQIGLNKNIHKAARNYIDTWSQLNRLNILQWPGLLATLFALALIFVRSLRSESSAMSIIVILFVVGLSRVVILWGIGSIQDLRYGYLPQVVFLIITVYLILSYFLNGLKDKSFKVNDKLTI